MTTETTSTASDGVRVEVRPGETQQLKATAEGASVKITDSKGRLLTIREPSILEESRLVRALGEAAANQPYMVLYALPAAMVAEIDGIELHTTNQVQLDAAIQRLGRHGIAAVMAHITSNAESRQEVGAADAKK